MCAKNLTLDAPGIISFIYKDQSAKPFSIETPCENVPINVQNNYEIHFIDDNKLTNEDLSKLNILHEFGDFKDLSLFENDNITGDGLKQLTDCDKFKTLSLHECQEIKDFSFLCNFTGLTYINLFCTYIDDEGLRALSNAKNISHIVMSCTELPTKKGFKCLVSKNEIFMEVDSSKNINDEIVETIAASLPNLFELNLDDCENITDECFTKLCLHKTLVRLHIIDCNNLTHKTFKYLSNSQSIKWLTCGRIQRSWTDDIYKPFTKIEINALSEMNSLESLHIYGITSEVIQDVKVLSKLPKLKYLTLSPVEQITKEHKENLQSFFPECKIDYFERNF